jgi:hypothetical protein
MPAFIGGQGAQGNLVWQAVQTLVEFIPFNLICGKQGDHIVDIGAAGNKTSQGMLPINKRLRAEACYCQYSPVQNQPIEAAGSVRVQPVSAAACNPAGAAAVDEGQHIKLSGAPPNGAVHPACASPEFRS